MDPKEKALELFNKNYRLFQNTDTCFGDCEEEFRKGNCTNSGHGCGIWFNLSKQCALIIVDEILTINDEKPYMLSGFKETFYKEVKKEIEKL